jgi:hypothetical protein
MSHRECQDQAELARHVGVTRQTISAVTATPAGADQA